MEDNVLKKRRIAVMLIGVIRISAMSASLMRTVQIGQDYSRGENNVWNFCE